MCSPSSHNCFTALHRLPPFSSPISFLASHWLDQSKCHILSDFSYERFCPTLGANFCISQLKLSYVILTISEFQLLETKKILCFQHIMYFRQIKSTTPIDGLLYCFQSSNLINNSVLDIFI